MQRWMTIFLFVLALGLSSNAFAENFFERLWQRTVEGQPEAGDQDPADTSHQGTQQQDLQTPEPHDTDAGFIACPLENVRTEVVSELPSPWWQTPQIDGLEETRVQNIGGDITLVCAYRAYGATASVMRVAPPGKTCTAVATGFNCH
jgi:hypothetical protein